MVTTILLSIAIGLVLALILLVIFLPDKVQYVETITVKAPISSVYDSIRFQEQLMAWSAWPTETKSQCFVKNTDGLVGAQTVYSKNGKEFGYQEITHLIENEKWYSSLKVTLHLLKKTLDFLFLLKNYQTMKPKSICVFQNY